MTARRCYLREPMPGAHRQLAIDAARPFLACWRTYHPVESDSSNGPSIRPNDDVDVTATSAGGYSRRAMRSGR